MLTTHLTTDYSSPAQEPDAVARAAAPCSEATCPRADTSLPHAHTAAQHASSRYSPGYPDPTTALPPLSTSKYFRDFQIEVIAFI